MIRKIIILLIILIIFLDINIYGQNKKLDSLLNRLKKTTLDSTSCRLMLLIGNQYIGKSPDTAIIWFNKVYALATKSGNKEEIFKIYTASSLQKISFVEFKYKENNKNSQEYSNKSLKIYEAIIKTSKNKEILKKAKQGMSRFYFNFGVLYMNQGNYDKAIDYYFNSLNLYKELDDKSGISGCCLYIGIYYGDQGSNDKALEYYLKALKIFEELGNKSQMAYCYINIAGLSLGSFDKILDYYLKSLNLFKELSDKGGMAYCYKNIGNFYSSHSNYKDAIDYYYKSLNLYNEFNDKKGISDCLNNIGCVNEILGLYDKASEYYFKSLNIYEELGDKYGITLGYINIAELNLSLADSSIGIKSANHLNEALKYALKSISLSQEIKALPLKKDAANTLMKAYQKMGNYKKALYYADIYISTKDSLFSEEKTKSLANAETKFKAEKKQLEIDKLNKEKELQLSELLRQKETGKRQKLIIVFIIVGLLLVGAFAVFVVQRLRITRKQKNIIELQRDEITEQHDLVVKQKDHIEEQKQEITDSINYAKRIQQAVLPSGEYAVNILGEHFILFKPKDIVSGDFYWATRINERLIITVADCTGHGVPGAFMSMLGVSFLNEIVRKKEITNAGEILDHLRKSIIEALKQKGLEGEQKDGMDITFCVLNTQTNILQFAGANNPLFIVNTMKELQVIQPDKQPVAIYVNMRPFTNNEIQLNKGDCIYLTSDGYEDQFGGPKNKKFMSKQLKELLVTIADKPMTEQKELLNQTFENWKNSNEQIDDVTVLGLKI